ncbi:MAG: GyrI-like domain-containing protein [Thermoleophilia bacterium]
MTNSGSSIGPAVAVHLRELPALATVALTARGPYWKLSDPLGRLREWLQDAEIRPTGPPLGIFHDDPARVPPEETRYTLCYPLDAAGVARAKRQLAAESRTGQPDAPTPEPQRDGDLLELMEFPATYAATAEYRGPAADSAAVYAQLERWMEDRGYTAAGPPREVYLAEPGTLGKGAMHAEVQQPLVRPPAPAAG